MAGIYIHIPFCTKACTYCDFHFSTVHKLKAPFVRALCEEIPLVAAQLDIGTIDTIYFGGGTPSLLSQAELSTIFLTLEKHFDIGGLKEVTLEANPEDLSAARLKELVSLPINRFSIGTQSFFDEHLKFMGRAHSAQQAEGSIKRAQDMGFENLTIDLIYGFPLLSDEQWKHNLNQVALLEIPHFSAYSLTVEQGTALHHGVQKGTIPPPKEAQAARHMEQLMEWSKKHEFEHYEISNFAKNGMFAIHNKSYWNGAYYIGVGPSAHSFLGAERRWNISNTPAYIKAISEGNVPFESESLSVSDQYNEAVMTGLRTQWGVTTQHLKTFGDAFLFYFEKEIVPILHKGWATKEDGRYCLTAQGKLRADAIAADLFWINEENEE